MTVYAMQASKPKMKKTLPAQNSSRVAEVFAEQTIPSSVDPLATLRSEEMCLLNGVMAADGYSVLPSCLMNILLMDDGEMAFSSDAMSFSIQTKPSSTVTCTVC